MGRESKSYPVTWEGRLVLACKKCQKKLKKAGGLPSLVGVRKTVKREGLPLHVLNVPCMDLCPKGGVVVFVGDRLRILRSGEDLRGLEED